MLYFGRKIGVFRLFLCFIAAKKINLARKLYFCSYFFLAKATFLAMRDRFYSKLLLFGEYAIIGGGQGLAVPFEHFSATWSQAEPTSRAAKQSRKSLWLLHKYITERADLSSECACDRMAADILAGWYLDSDIPTGYGLGSSGAAAAAVFSLYFAPVSSLAAAHWFLSQIESCFHGTSSGLDPLVCYCHQPILISHNQPNLLPALSPTLPTFLIDTGNKRSTTPLVNQFKIQCEDAQFLQALSDFKTYNAAAISAWLGSNAADAANAIRQISRWQLQYFRAMIPDRFIPLWQKGLDSDSFSLKICGAGGGGYMLAFAHDPNCQNIAELADYKLLRL
jgi:mevalonate kinase